MTPGWACGRHSVAGMPVAVVVMGVSGTGKSTIAKGMAERLGWEFGEGDAFHPQANIDKMASGHALTDEDRWPWLESIGTWISDETAAGRSLVVTCSALRRVYRDLLRQGRPDVVFCHVTVPTDVVRDRMEHRKNHFMPPSLLESQLATLEPLEADEPGFEVVNSGTAAAAIRQALEELQEYRTAHPEE